MIGWDFDFIRSEMENYTLEFCFSVNSVVGL
uniref:Uncharacterized protein n=1 Tax=Rhizophora mucronata TaxID=61149 RepID=A0A2P2NPM9_RHIMU